MAEDETERPLQNDKEQQMSVHIVVGKKRKEFDLTKKTFGSEKKSSASCSTTMTGWIESKTEVCKNQYHSGKFAEDVQPAAVKLVL